MESPLLQIQRELQRYLDGEIELHQFEDAFVPRLWDIDREGDDATTEFAGRVHNLIAEYSRGDRTEGALRQELAEALHALRAPTI